MRTTLLTLALGIALALGLVWFLGGFDVLGQWAAQGQREFQNAMAGALRRLRAGEVGALLALLAMAFAYGFFHAAGPGHGKILIGGYGAGTSVRLLPLVGIALVSSLVQATTAVVLVFGGFAVLDWTREDLVGLGEGAMTSLSILAIGLIGAWLVYRGGRGIVRQWRLTGPGARSDHTGGLAVDGAGVAAGQGVSAPMAYGAPDDSVQRQQGIGHDHAHHGPDAVCASCGHRHGPSMAEVARLTGWRDAAILVAAIGIRPCTGALFLLILTWNMGIVSAGVAGTYAMGLGTATITVAVASVAVLARDGALVWSGRLAGLSRIAPVLEIAAGAVVVLVATQMLMRGY